MDISESSDGGATVLHIAGRINSANASEVGERVSAFLERGSRAIVIDMSHLEHLTSAGFRSLLFAERRVHAAGAAMVICGLRDLTRELFEIGGFLDMFTTAASRSEALRLVAVPALEG